MTVAERRIPSSCGWRALGDAARTRRFLLDGATEDGRQAAARLAGAIRSALPSFGDW